MNTEPTTNNEVGESYADQLRRIARAMAGGHSHDLVGELEEGSRADMLKDFADGNFDKRVEKLTKGLEFMAPAFEEEFEDLLIAYVKAMPSAAYDSGQFDGERFLQWLSRTRNLTPEQRDYVACQQARNSVEVMGRNNRLAHIRFQDLRSLSEVLAPELGQNPTLQIHLNPLRVWTTFHTSALIDDEDEPPTDVLFFPIGNYISTALLEEDGRQLLEELSRYEPCTLATWSALSEHADRDDLIELCHDLAEMGLVAFS